MVLRGYRHQPLHIGWRGGWDAWISGLLTHLDDKVLEARGRRKQEQPGWCISFNTEAMRDVARSKGPCARPRRNARLSTQNRHLSLNHIEGLVLVVMPVPGRGKTSR